MKITAENITVVRGEDIVIDKLTLEVATGSALIVRGANGSGKSTLLRALAGLLPLENGVIKLTGNAEFGDAKLPDLCHYLGHDNAMKTAMTVGENLTFWQDFAGQPHLDIGQGLEMVGLGGLETIPFAHLSTGQRRRASIARLIVSWRPVWLLDEPTSGLDATSETQFVALMQAHLEDGGLIVAATHLPLEITSAKFINLEPVSP